MPSRNRKVEGPFPQKKYRLGEGGQKGGSERKIRKEGPESWDEEEELWSGSGLMVLDAGFEPATPTMSM